MITQTDDYFLPIRPHETMYKIQTSNDGIRWAEALASEDRDKIKIELIKIAKSGQYAFTRCIIWQNDQIWKTMEVLDRRGNLVRLDEALTKWDDYDFRIEHDTRESIISKSDPHALAITAAVDHTVSK